jgi:hypothetical protein
MLLIGFLLGHQERKRMRPYTIYIEDAAKFAMEKEKFLYLPYALIYILVYFTYNYKANRHILAQFVIGCVYFQKTLYIF